MPCNPHPHAPHGFMRDESHNAGRYVCECEFWNPKDRLEVAVDDRLVAAHIGTLDSFTTGREALDALINWEVMVALDPRVSKEAAELVNKAANFDLVAVRELLVCLRIACPEFGYPACEAEYGSIQEYIHKLDTNACSNY